MQLNIWCRALLSFITVTGLSRYGWCTTFIAPGDLDLIFQPFVDTIEYRYIYHISFQDCMKECWLRSRCHSVVYNRLALVCGISQVVNVSNIQTNVAETHANGIYVNIDAIDGYTIGDCTVNSCGDTDKCEPSTFGTGYECVTTECLVPEDTANGHALVSWASLHVRAIALYECQDGLTSGSGSPISMCLEDGTWSIPGLQCGANCSEPSIVDTADLLYLTGLPWRQGTKITYQCKPGFQTWAGRMNATSTCNSIGEWVPRVVGCCPDGWWLSGIDSCIIYYNGSTVTNIEEMRNVCTQQGGFMLGVNSQAQLNSTRDGVLLQYQTNQTVMNDLTMDNFTDPVRFQALRDCMTSFGYSPSPLLPYSNVIATCSGNSNLMQCPDVDLWASNQPSNVGNCTVYGEPTGYLLKDTPCNFTVPGSHGFLCKKFYNNLI